MKLLRGQQSKLARGLFFKCASSLYFLLLNTADSKKMFNTKFWRWLDTNCGPLVLKATALPTQPHPLHVSCVACISVIRCFRVYKDQYKFICKIQEGKWVELFFKKHEIYLPSYPTPPVKLYLINWVIYIWIRYICIRYI